MYGIWPSIEEDTTSDAPGYFSNPALYERDRPIFQQFIPVLRKINFAGWQPLTFATASDSRSNPGNLETTTAATTSVAVEGNNASARFSVERFGSAADGVVYWTLRRAEPPPLQPKAGRVAGPRPVRFRLHAASLGLAPRVTGYAMSEIAHRTIAIPPVVVTTAVSAAVDVELPDLPHNTTFVLQLTTV